MDRGVYGSIQLPKERTFARWVSLAWSRYSLLRALQYEAISGLRLTGRVLDLGGDSRSEYYRLLTIDGVLETVNLMAEAAATHCCDLEQPLPFQDESYDHVISLNTFEHLRHDVQAIAEAIRVLKEGGSFHFLVPFCHRVHRGPRDYHRHTGEWWLETVRTYAGCSVRVEPLVWDRRSTGVAVMKGGRLVRAAAMALPDVRELVRAAGRTARRGTKLGRNLREAAAEFALGYYISGTRSKR